MALNVKNQNRLNRLNTLQQGGQQLNNRQLQNQQVLQNRLQTPGYGPVYGEKNFNKGRNLNTVGGAVAGQQAENVGAAQTSNTMNNPNIQGPFGQGQQVTYDPVTGQPTVSVTAATGQEGLYGQEVGLESAANQQAQNIMGQGLFNQPLTAAGAYQGFQPLRQEVMGALNADFNQTMDPQFAQEKEQLEQWAANTGNQPGSPQYEARSRQLADAQNRARVMAQSQATQLANQATESGFRMGQDIYNQPYKNVKGLMDLGQGVQAPSYQGFQGTPVAPTDVAGTAANFANIRQSGANARLSSGTALQMQREDQAYADRIRREEEDRQAGGDTSTFVGGTTSAARTGGTVRNARGGLSDMGRGLRNTNQRRRR